MPCGARPGRHPRRPQQGRDARSRLTFAVRAEPADRTLALSERCHERAELALGEVDRVQMATRSQRCNLKRHRATRKSPEQLDGEIQAVFDYSKAGKPGDIERWVDDWIRENRGKAWARPMFAKEYVKAIRGMTFR